MRCLPVDPGTDTTASEETDRSFEILAANILIKAATIPDTCVKQ
jgi:hypothetical protein